MDDLNELKHYGIIGMKWGIRKAQKSGSTYSYKSMGQKKYEKKVQDLKSKGASSKSVNEASKKLEMYKTRDRSREDYARVTSVGKSVVKGILMGPLGSSNYNRMRAAGAGIVPSVIVGNWLSGSALYPATLAYTKHRENVAAEKRMNRR